MDNLTFLSEEAKIEVRDVLLPWGRPVYFNARVVVSEQAGSGL